jgi:hypothetical protein
MSICSLYLECFTLTSYSIESTVSGELMARQDSIPLESPSEWKEALQGIPHAFAHTWESCQAMYLSSGYKTFLYSYQSGDVRIVCPLAERPFGDYLDIVTPYGFSGFIGNSDCPDFPEHFRQYMQQKGYVCSYIAQNPLFENDSYLEPAAVFQMSHVYILDLRLSADALFENLSTNRRRQLKDWDRITAGVLFGEDRLADFFIEKFNSLMREKNASDVYQLSEKTLTSLVGLDNVFLVGVEEAGEIVAVMLFAHTAELADYLFGMALERGRRHSAALLWYGIKQLKTLKVPFMNLGGGITADDGVADFKRRFGGKKVMSHCLKQVYAGQIYGDLCRSVGADPDRLSGYFPAYRSP